MEAPAQIEFSRLISTTEIVEKAAVFTIEADKAERAGLAERFDLRALHRLWAELLITPEAGGRLRLDGHLTADVVQTCVVSLADVATPVDGRFSLCFSPEVAPEPVEILIDPGEDDPPELLVGKSLDLGRIIAEQLAMALAPYPRLSGAKTAEFKRQTAEKEETASPFAVLSVLKGAQ